jgi:lipopolysaccharide/colanic/teichoic acid biosynthesis glycosyltransferase
MPQMQPFSSEHAISQDWMVPEAPWPAREPRRPMTRSYKEISVLFVVDLVLVAGAFLTINFLKRDTLLLPLMYLKMLGVYLATVAIVSFTFGKYHQSNHQRYLRGVILISKCAVLSCYLVALLIVFLGLTAYSRLYIFGAFGLLLFAELTAFTLYYRTALWRKIHVNGHRILKVKGFLQISLLRLFNGFVLITFSFFILHYFRKGSWALSDEYEKILLVIYGVWLASAIFTRSFKISHYRTFFYFIAPQLKSFFLMTAIMAVIIFSFRLFYYSRMQIFGAILLMLIIETVYNILYFLDIRNQKGGLTLASNKLQDVIQRHVRGERKTIPQPSKCNGNKSCRAKNFGWPPALYEFIDARLGLSNLSDDEIIHLNSLSWPQTNGGRAPRVLINDYRVNDMRRINRYFLQVHNKVMTGGYFIGRFEPVESYRQRKFFLRYPRRLAFFLYYLNCLWVRVAPKTPKLKAFYFMITRGRNRVLTTAEVLGRLCYCGFQIVDTLALEGEIFFIAQKMFEPSSEKRPSYGLLTSFKRVGMGGKIIHVMKLRTMHPYSEYLQEYVYAKNHLAASGKLNDDFRISKYGRIFRKYWLDELPQIINFFRGDLSLIGVRALSPHYFSLYPEDLQKLRIQFKPGLIPPYYADLPKSFEEVIESERRYLLQKQAHPFKTDVKYLARILNNILIKRAHGQ